MKDGRDLGWMMIRKWETKMRRNQEHLKNFGAHPKIEPCFCGEQRRHDQICHSSNSTLYRQLWLDFEHLSQPSALVSSHSIDWGSDEFALGRTEYVWSKHQYLHSWKAQLVTNAVLTMRFKQSPRSSCGQRKTSNHDA